MCTERFRRCRARAGRVERPIEVEEAEPGRPVQVLVQVYGDNGAVIGETSLSFRPWWE